MRRPVVLWIVAAFVFFLPLRTVEIPSIVAGLSVNPARFIIAAGVLLLAGHFAVYGAWREGSVAEQGDAGVGLLAVYFALSTCAYYVFLLAGETAQFATGDSFFRSYRGRPLAQMVSFFTYAVFPFFLIRKYASDPDHRRFIVKALAASVILLIVYGYMQQLSYYAGLPVTGRQLYEPGGARIPTFSAGGVIILRFYSLGGEPRDLGTFILGGVAFLLYALSPRRMATKALVALGVAAVLLAASTSALLAAVLMIVVITMDSIIRGGIRPRHLIFAGIAVVAFVAFVSSDLGAILFSRTILYWTVFTASPGEIAASARDQFVQGAQAVDVGGLFYIMELPSRPLHNILFGYGFGNYGGGMAELLRTRFALDISADPYLSDTRSFALKLLVETGIVGLAGYFAVFVAGLRRQAQLERAASGDEAKQLRALRHAYIGFFVAALVQTGFYHFILLGLLMAYPAPHLARTRREKGIRRSLALRPALQ